MKTSGELLREKRLQLDWSIEDISRRIKVKSQFLEALEKNDFSALPSSAFTKGFLRNYAQELRLNPDTVLAMFRRDFAENESGSIVPTGLVDPVNKNNRSRLSVPTMLIAALLISFLSFLGFQVWRYYSLPGLELISPADGETYSAKITVKGKADPDAVVTINNQKVVIAPSGEFSLDLLFAPGTHSVVVKAVNRQNKSRLLQRTFQIAE